MERVVDGKYTLVRQLGEGGMGAVYEARHLGTGRRVALKLISRDVLVKSADIVTRFEREARAAGQLESPHVAQVLDTGRDGESGEPYLVLELLRGEDLAELVTRVGPLEDDLALRILAQALAGLRCAHEAGIVHRDIKPANLFLSKGARDEIVVKLLDFGIAKVRADPFAAAERADVALTRTGSMLGSPLYMSPEQAKSAKDLDHRCDLWSMGVLLHEALSGATPYGEIESLGELIIDICAGRERNVQTFAPWVSPEVAHVVHRALHPDIALRYQSATEMLADVEALVMERKGVAREVVTSAMIAPLSVASRSRVARALSSSVSPFATTTGPAQPSMSSSEMLGSTLDAASANVVVKPQTQRRSIARWVAGASVGVVVVACATIGVARWVGARAPATPSAAVHVSPPAITLDSTEQSSPPPPEPITPNTTHVASAPTHSPRSRPTASASATTPVSPTPTATSAPPPSSSGFANDRHG